MNKLKELKDYIVFDTETSGLNPREDKILEYGCIKVRGDKIVDSLRIISKQNVTIPVEASRIHGITNEVLLKEGIDPKEACSKCMEFIGNDAVLGLNNIAFDFPFLETECNRFGITRPCMDKWYDVGMWHKGIHIGNIWNGNELFYKYALRVRDIRAKGVKYNLDFLTKTYGCENLREEGVHTAIADIRMTKNIFDKMREKYCI